jgi:hypothetical protein
MKSVPNFISYLHEFFQNFSHFLAICFELFSFRMIFKSEITDSRPHLSDAARRAGPARQPAVAAWLPRAARLARTLRPMSGQRAARPDSPALAPAPTAPRLARAVVAPTASPIVSPSQPKPLARRRRAAIPAPVSRPFLGRLPRAGTVPIKDRVGCALLQ